MIKKINIIIIIMTILMVVSGCSSQKNPEATVSEFIEAMKKFNLEEMSLKINPEDRDGKEQVTNLYENEEDQMEKYFLDYIKDNAKKITYEIKNTKLNEDNAVVTVSLKYVDGGPLFKATFSEYMAEAFALIFSGKEPTDEENSEMFIRIMEEQSEIIEEAFVEKTLEINCIKIDDEWYINSPSEELLDVTMSNILSVGQEFEDSFDFDLEDDTNETNSVMEQAELDGMNVIEKHIGDEITLGTIKIKVTEVEETETLTPSYGSPISAKEGAKFVLMSMDVTNITKSEISLSPNFMLVDNYDREFSSYSNSIGAIDDYLDYRDLSPSIKETGTFIYELPKDATSYFMIIGKSGTDDLYKIILN